MKLIVGLGNPGKKYERTRHNAGFWWLERLARAANVEFRREKKEFYGDVAKLMHPAEVWLLRPATFMNESGRAVGALKFYYNIAPHEILIVHDELDLLPGVAKIKLGGGTSGHNGLRNIALELGDNEFWRLRLGIGHPRDSASNQEVVDYVLHTPSAEEQSLIDDAIKRSIEVWPLIVTGDMEAAMLRLHTKEKKPE